MTKLLLASSSRYRSALLKQLQMEFSCVSPDVDESPLDGESPRAMVERLSRMKVEALTERFPGHTIIGSDQTASLNGTLLSKPGDHQHAVSQLAACSGHRVRFYTGLCVYHGGSNRWAGEVTPTDVQFRKLSPSRIERYLEREKPYDCAGSFKCEGLGISLFESIESADPSALVGLPLIALRRLLNRFGLDPLD